LRLIHPFNLPIESSQNPPPQARGARGGEFGLPWFEAALMQTTPSTAAGALPLTADGAILFLQTAMTYDPHLHFPITIGQADVQDVLLQPHVHLMVGGEN